MLRSSLFAALLLASLGLVPASARADMVVEGYKEKCRLNEVQRDGESCVECGAWHAHREACRHLGDEGYAERCRTAGASVWTEIWCRNGARTSTGTAALGTPGPGSGA